MRVTIVKDDNVVTVDGEGHRVDCSSLPASFHALRWDGASGELEHRMTVCEHCGTRSKKPNEHITDLAPYQHLLDAWRAAKVAADAEKAERDAARPEA